MTSANQAWLDQVVEAALEPELPICDSHHHLWDVKYPGVQVQERYLLDDLLADLASGHNIVSTVYIECAAMYGADVAPEMRTVGEVEFAGGIAAMSASGLYGPTRVAAGIVGHADLRRGDGAKAVLEALIEAGCGRFRGIRHGAAWVETDTVHNSLSNPPPELFHDSIFREGFRHLAPLGLSFETWLYHPQLADVPPLAKAFPETTMILNHFGGPLGVGPFAGKREEIFEAWKPRIDAIAECPNVVAKLGGINMRINGFGWHSREKPPSSEALAAATRRWYEHVIERFGPERCLFESNFPVDKLSCSYGVLWNSFKRIAAGCSADEKAALFHDTASRVYRLEASG